jgi:hypothetical protein
LALGESLGIGEAVTDMTVVVPSRGRPDNIKRLIQAWADTQASAKLVVGLDRDDEAFNDESGAEIDDLIAGLGFRGRVSVSVSDPKGMCWTLNEIATGAAQVTKYVGFMGDDHLPRTLHWDARLAVALQDMGVGVAYGNDLMQRAALPTAVFMTSNIINALGYMAPPSLTHLYLDNVWRDWGQGIKKYAYLEDVVIEHMHFQAGKSEVDEGYLRVNGGEMWAHDCEAYRVYCAEQENLDLEKLRAL